MAKPELTISETIAQIQHALRDYIEATYHVSHPTLVDQRRALLETPGVIHQPPYLESTPRYVSGSNFADLEIPEEAKAAFAALTGNDNESGLLFDPPYSHQAKALTAALGEGKSLVITTGTGSGKTESFLLPILGKLAIEAKTSPSFAAPAMRAILLYPMNALVNDQLGRLRLLFGSDDVASMFIKWADRPARFARYTSRTMYPGVRTSDKDSERLKSIEKFYVSLLRTARDLDSPDSADAARVIEELQTRGKWPAKPDLEKWYGAKGTRWKKSNGDFARAVTLPDDRELLTRHEVLEAPPDLLVTNYSMLEYMLMRPLERPVFDKTARWLAENPEQRLMLVVDEAHLYRGAAGAEVALLIRRLRARLGIEADRLQVICTSASFNEPTYAAEFAAQLTGKAPEDFEAIAGELALRPEHRTGTSKDAEALATVSVESFRLAESNDAKLTSIEDFLAYRGVEPLGDYAKALHEALTGFGPMGELINTTMTAAVPLSQLGEDLFPGVDPSIASKAVTGLVTVGSAAKLSHDAPSLLPCRIHSFFRGLPGLWACLDPDCEGAKSFPPGPVGRIYGQPMDSCESCGARVYEIFTCRNCGSAYARGYVDDVEDPRFLWSEPGTAFESAVGAVDEHQPLDLLLEDPLEDAVQVVDVDLVTGRLDPLKPGERMRKAYLKRDRFINSDRSDEQRQPPKPGEFAPCGVCGTTARFGRTSVQDHQTKGDQPFLALISRQIEVQPPGRAKASQFAPLRGRKVLTFADSRQTAARLAPNLQAYSMQDALRPVLLRGWRELESVSAISERLTLEDLFLAALLGAQMLEVRLRPEVKQGESTLAEVEVARAVAKGLTPAALQDLFIDVRSETPPESLLRGIHSTIHDQHLGFGALALASLRESPRISDVFADLPDIPGVAETNAQKVGVARAWISRWTDSTAGIRFDAGQNAAIESKLRAKAHSGGFTKFKKWLGPTDRWKIFENEWLPVLQRELGEHVTGRQFRILAKRLALDTSDGWVYCGTCKTAQRPIEGSSRCVNCTRSTLDKINPDTDPVFSSRKGYYRSSAVRALGENPDPPVAIIASEHTAQLNSAKHNEVFSKAEEHELRFQDLDLKLPGDTETRATAIDVLSCTTTMEVGIDIGALSGVALRNMPPSRANYQQRAGRAGRRGDAVATVIAFGSADSHDDHYFRRPDEMIRGDVDDPVITLDNSEIARRHVTAYLLQRYHAAKLPSIEPDEQRQLFEVLGSVLEFTNPASILSRDGFETWMKQHESELRISLDSWLPSELSAPAREGILDDFVTKTLDGIDEALHAGNTELPEVSVQEDVESDEDVVEVQPEEGDDGSNGARETDSLLDRLLYKGVLPRYAFPTDVVAFHVFDPETSTKFRPEFEYAPSQGLATALSQYAPGKRVWIDGKEWKSGAIYSPMASDRFEEWNHKHLYFECPVCHYAVTKTAEEATRGEVDSCPACGFDRFGPAMNWMVPVGFAHPYTWTEETSTDDQPANSYATRAKLSAKGPVDPSHWTKVTPRLNSNFGRRHLLVTNTGPRREGYSYCTKCGRIGPSGIPTDTVTSPHHKPFPGDKELECPGLVSHGLVLGTDFISDVLLMAMRVEKPATLRPGALSTDVALRTVSEALIHAASRRLDIDSSEIQAEYRPALTEGGQQGLEAEVYMYDTLSGGAGFSRQAGALGESLFEDALEVLESCPANCDRSCYRCLRRFGNRFEHDLLDRKVGASLLRSLLDGSVPTFDESRLASAEHNLYEDLRRISGPEIEFERSGNIEIAGVGHVLAPILVKKGGRKAVVAVHGPLTPDFVTDEQLMNAKENSFAALVILVDELLVHRNLPAASEAVLDSLA